MRQGRRQGEVRVRLSRDHPHAIDGLRRHALRRLLPGPDLAGLLWLGIPARRHVQRRQRLDAQRLVAAPVGRPVAGDCRAGQGRDHPRRGRADTAEADEALGQRQGRAGGRRCRGRRGAGLGRGHLLRNGMRADCRRGGRAMPGHGRCQGAADGAAAVHEGPWPGILDPGAAAGVLVFLRQAAGTLRQHVRGSGCAAADLGILHEQEADPERSAGACAHLLQGYGAFAWAGPRMILNIVIAVIWGVLVAGLGAYLTELSPWYYEVLKQPSWQPPDWLFGPAWSVILALASWAFYLGLRDAPDAANRSLVISLFVLNGLANLAWSPLFFRLQRPDWALFEVPFLWLAIPVPMVLLLRISGTASLLL